MTNMEMTFYSVLKNEDANPFIGGNLLIAADGLGGSGSSVHIIDRTRHGDLHSEIWNSAFRDIRNTSPEFGQFTIKLLLPMEDDRSDTSALWGSRVVMGRCAFALTEGGFKDADLSDENVRKQLAEYIYNGLCWTAEQFDLQKGKYDSQKLLPTTLAFIRYTEKENSVVAETVWAGDSRCYALTPEGLKILSVDDEDASGSITNLFCVEVKNTVLNYKRHEIPKPCALFACSDGLFDPFDPHDNLGVEYVMLSCIKDSGSIEELSKKLKVTFDGIHGDDATMAFKAFGFADYADMRGKLEARSGEVIGLFNKQIELRNSLEVLNQSEEDASHYISARTGDRFNYIAPLIADAVCAGQDDIVITQEIKDLISGADSRYKEAEAKEAERLRAQALLGLDNYVKAHPEAILTEILSDGRFDFSDEELMAAFTDLRSSAEQYYSVANKESINKEREALRFNARQLHVRVNYLLRHQRDVVDNLWNAKTIDSNKFRYYIELAGDLQYLDTGLLCDWKLSGRVKKLERIDNALRLDLIKYDDARIRLENQISQSQKKEKDYRGKLERAWGKLYELIKLAPSLVKVLLKPECLKKLNLDGSGAAAPVGGKGNARDRAVNEILANKTAIIPVIVRALAENYDKTSIIDGQYNATKLEMFRTYYRLKANPDGGLHEFEQQLAAVEKEYESLVR